MEIIVYIVFVLTIIISTVYYEGKCKDLLRKQEEMFKENQSLINYIDKQKKGK